MTLILALAILLVSAGGRAARECGKFASQCRALLAHEMLSPEQLYQTTQSSNKLLNKLQTRWKGAELFAYGSLFTGLGTRNSDIDYYLRIPNYNSTADRYFVRETAELLYKEPSSYDHIVLWLNRSVPMMSYYDVKMQRNIDLSFRSTSGVENTKLIAYYLNLDNRYVPLTALIKYWGKVHYLTGKGLLPNYALYLMVIFYLQQKNMSPSGQQMQKNVSPILVNKWNVNFEEIPFVIKNDESVYELLGGFFKYYSSFNFTKYCASVFVGRPVARSDLEHFDTIPEAFSMYKSHLETGEDEPLSLHTGMCVQDVFVHNNNAAKRVGDKNALIFMNNIQSAAKLYEESSCDEFLRDIII